jgi:DNA repair and recombination RAD54-like protein
MRKFVSAHNNGKYHVLIASYETFRKHTAKFKRRGSIDLLICDEAHRLKNAETQTNKELGALPCASRILISGTPLQNHLDEFFSMVNFCNPGLLGTANEFHKRYERPILAGREPGEVGSATPSLLCDTSTKGCLASQVQVSNSVLPVRKERLS